MPAPSHPANPNRFCGLYRINHDRITRRTTNTTANNTDARILGSAKTSSSSTQDGKYNYLLGSKGYYQKTRNVVCAVGGYEYMLEEMFLLR